MIAFSFSQQCQKERDELRRILDAEPEKPEPRATRERWEGERMRVVDLLNRSFWDKDGEADILTDLTYHLRKLGLLSAGLLEARNQT